MRRVLLAGAALIALATAQPALAADLPVKVPPPAAAFVNWSGFYIGGHVGGAWSDVDWSGISFNPGTTYSFHPSGFAGGAHTGINHQIEQWVLGIETSWTWTSASNGFVASPSNSYATDIDWFATVVGRFGYTWDRWLLYVSGGYAAGRVTAIGTGGGLPGPFRFAGTDSGWTIGAGVEVMLPNNFFFGAEYKYIDLGGGRSGVTPLPFGIPVAISGVDTRIQAVTARLSHKFDWVR